MRFHHLFYWSLLYHQLTIYIQEPVGQLRTKIAALILLGNSNIIPTWKISKSKKEQGSLIYQDIQIFTENGEHTNLRKTCVIRNQSINLICKSMN